MLDTNQASQVDFTPLPAQPSTSQPSTENGQRRIFAPPSGTVDFTPIGQAPKAPAPPVQFTSEAPATGKAAEVQFTPIGEPAPVKPTPSPTEKPLGLAGKVGEWLTKTKPSPTGILGTAPAQAREFVEKAGNWAETPLVESALGFHEPTLQRHFPEGSPMAKVEAVESGLAKGAYHFAAGLTTPENLALYAVFGLGTTGEKLGADFVAQNFPKYLPQFEKALKVTKGLAALGFGSQQLYAASQTLPQFNVAVRNGDYEKAAQYATQATLLTAAGAMTAAYGVGKLAPSKPWKAENRVIGTAQRETEVANVKAAAFEKQHKGLIQDRDTDLAGLFYHEAQGDVGKLEEWKKQINASDKAKPEIKQRYTQIINLAEQLPEHVKQLSENLKEAFRRDWEIAKSAHKLDPAAEGRGEAYAGTHEYLPDNALDSTLKAPRAPGKKPGLMRERKFDNLADAVSAGFTPKPIGLAERRADYIRKFGGMLSAIKAEDYMMATRAEDGRFLAVPPNSIRQLGSKRVAVLAKDTDVSAIDPARIIERNGRRFLDVSDYQDADPKGPFTRFKVIATDSEGNPVFQKAPVSLHPDIAGAINKAWDQSSWFRKNPLLSAALKTSTLAKETLLTLSPFHLTTEALRGISIGMSVPELFSLPELAPEQPAVSTGTQFGLVLKGGDRAAQSAYAEGVASNGGLLGKVPGLNKVLGGFQSWLFQDYLPRMKAAAWERIVPQLEKQYPNWTPERRYVLASKLTNSLFGLLNWKQLGVTMSGLDAMHLMLLAPDFLSSQLLYLKAGAEPNGGIVFNSFARILLYNLGVAQLGNILVTGKPDLTHPLSVTCPWDESKSISVRTLPEDLYRLATDHNEFIANRLNPITMRTVWEAYSGRNIRNEKVDTPLQVIDAIKNVVPISLQNFLFPAPETPPAEGVTRGLGFKVSPNYSPALVEAKKLASDRTEGGPVDSSKLAHHQFIISLEDGIRDGRIGKDSLKGFVQQGALTLKEREEILESLKETRRVADPLQAQLYLRAKRLPLADSIAVWNLSTKQEKAILSPLMRDKRLRYIQNANKNLTAQERLQDKLLQQLRHENFR